MAKNENPSHDYSSGRIYRAGQGMGNENVPPAAPRPAPDNVQKITPQRISWDDDFTSRPVQSQPRPAPPPRPVRPQQSAPPQRQMQQQILPITPGAPKGPGAEYSSPYVKPVQRTVWDEAQTPPPPPKKPGGPKSSSGSGGSGGSGRKPAPKKRGTKIVVSLLLVLLLLSGVALAGVLYTGQLLDPGALGKIVPPLGADPKAYDKKDVVHILIIGIDYEEGRQYGDGLGLTDMILYARYDLKNNKLDLLQIPRDSYVGEERNTGGTGKINALLISGPDKESPINNLAESISTQFKLPVDHYVAMDMDALKTIVDTFGGIRVYVSQDMEYGGSYLPQGWQWLDGNAAEFFVRNRKGEGFARGDIDRLDNQRHFYSALFRRFLNLTPKDVMNLLPVFDHYCNTDISLKDMVGIGVAGLNLKAENVTFAKVPGATGEGLDPTGAGRSLYIIDLYGRGTPEDPGLASLLNQYYRAPEQPVESGALGLPQIQIPGSYALYSPNVQQMADVQAPEGGVDVDVEPVA